MRTIWRRIVLGARWSEEQGSHPGTPLLLLFGILGAIAGAERRPWGSVIGASIMLGGMGPLWVYRCYEAGSKLEEWRRKARE